MAINLFGITDKIKALKETHPVWGEVVKQLIDQPLHVVMAWASIWAIAFPLHCLGVQIVANLVFAGSLTGFWMTLREISQGKSSRPWDKPLDVTFQLGGWVLGIHSFLMTFG